MNNYYETGLIETEYFDEIFSTLFDVALVNERYLEDLFFRVAGGLERKIQDLEDYGQESRRFVKEIVTTLKYWGEILKRVKKDYQIDFVQPTFTVMSYIYAINNLLTITSTAVDIGKGKISYLSLDNLRIDLNRCGPIPPIDFLENFKHKNKVWIYNPLYHYTSILSNYFYRRFHFFINLKLDEKTKDILNMINEEVFKYDEKPNRTILDIYIEESVISKPVNNLPTFIYLDTNDGDEIHRYYSSILSLIGRLGFETKIFYPEKRGSWFKKLFSNAKEILSSEEVQERLKKIEHGIELHTIQKQQSEVDKNQAEAISSIMNASEKIPNIATLIGSLLFIKSTNENGKIVVFCKTLTTKEMIFINDNPSLITNPNQLLHQMQKGLIEQGTRD